MLAALPHKDLVPPFDINTIGHAVGWTGRPFVPYIAVASSCNTLLYRHLLRATSEKGRTCSVACLPGHSRHAGPSFTPQHTRFAFVGRSYSSDKEADS
ncbi:hypothetical protein PoB_002179000 [Plakobranchus ocellatus]|uniref:Uncharacterized protein n=1 Tax=Plakobranchus ocellatus TaxID=259542 RepID=A0AAV3ZI22_9GAST|nr:hypothetical protein PoB_002179000 [Plakobranchus ocellatus]